MAHHIPLPGACDRGPAKILVGGRWTEARADRFREIRNPTTLDPLARAPDCGQSDVDAAMRAVQRMVGEEPRLQVTDFHLDAISGGSDAIARVTLVVEDDRGRRASADAAHEDIVIASVEAMVAAVNQLLRRPPPDVATAIAAASARASHA